MNLNDLADLCIRHVLSTPTMQQFVLSIFITFFVVYRYNVQRRIRYHNHIEPSDLTMWLRFRTKILNCESCFGFWLCLLISTNLTTAAAAFLLYNLYEKN